MAKFVLPPHPSAVPARPVRDPLRPEIRGRNGEILVRRNRSNDAADQFDVPRVLIERGWTLQWVCESVLGKPQPQNVQNHLENGWRPVMADRADGYFHPPGHVGAISREGMILMERPEELTRQALEDGRNAAVRQRHNQAADFQGVQKVLTETGGADAAFSASNAQTDSRGVARTMLKRTVEPVPQSLYPNRELALGDEE